MTQEEWLSQHIDAAFAGVELGTGLDIHAAQYLDSLSDSEKISSLTAERKDWKRVSSEVFPSRHSAITYLDPEGFRFYTPALMTMFIIHGDEQGMLLNHFLWNLKVTIHGKIKGVHFSSLFNLHQRAAILRFLKYLIHHECKHCDFGEASTVLMQIQSRTSH